MTLVIYPPVDGARLAKVQAAAGDLRVVNCSTYEDALQEIITATAFFGKLTPELLENALGLEWVQSPTASLEHYLFPELIAHPCRLSNMRGLFYDVIADHVFAYITCIARNLHHYLRQKTWEPIGGSSAVASGAVTPVDTLVHGDGQNQYGPCEVTEIDRRHLHLADCTIGVVGVGSIGSEICRRAQAFGMRILGVDPDVRSVDDIVPEVWNLARLPELLSASDFVVIAAPHTPDTEKLFRAEQFASMRSNAWLINIGRGVIVDLTDLTSALQTGQIAGAALDVCEIEPLPSEHPLWSMENVIITPHVAAASPRVSERHLETLLENVKRFANGDEPLNLVDKHRWY